MTKKNLIYINILAIVIDVFVITTNIMIGGTFAIPIIIMGCVGIVISTAMLVKLLGEIPES